MKKGIKKLINFYYVVYGSIIIILYPYIGLMFDNIKKICLALNCSINDLFESTDNKMQNLILAQNKSDTE